MNETCASLAKDEFRYSAGNPSLSTLWVSFEATLGFSPLEIIKTSRDMNHVLYHRFTFTLGIVPNKRCVSSECWIYTFLILNATISRVRITPLWQWYGNHPGGTRLGSGALS